MWWQDSIKQTLDSTIVTDLLLKIAQGATTDENDVFGQAIGLYWSYGTGSTGPGILIRTVNFIKKYQIDWSDLLVNWLCWSYGRSTYWSWVVFFDFVKLNYWMIKWSFWGELFWFWEISESFGFKRSILFLITSMLIFDISRSDCWLSASSGAVCWNDNHYSYLGQTHSAPTLNWIISEEKQGRARYTPNILWIKWNSFTGHQMRFQWKMYIMFCFEVCRYMLLECHAAGAEPN